VLGPAPAGSVLVHLFDWKWTDIALECENYLGPSGFAGVQVSPPSEHAIIASADYPWWERYQTVDYSLAESRSGTEAEFADMVQRCAKVGVRIYVDAVFNAMTGQATGVGSNGTMFTKYAYPGLYTPSDFHQPPCAIQGSDYTDNADHVRICELDGLADLNTATEKVRDTIAGYLNALVDLGVAGFRVDSAKHMYPADLDAIVQAVNKHAGPSRLPFFYFEVAGTGVEAVMPSDYLAVGSGTGQPISVTEFKYAALFDQFETAPKISSLKSLLTTSADYLPSAQALVFTTNHDTERGTAVYYQDGKAYDLATVFLLAWPHGYPSLMSSFAFDRATSAGQALGPPSDKMGHTNSIYATGSTTPNCAPDPHNPPAGSWVCQHRDPFVPRMLAFRKALAAETAVTDFWDDGDNQIAFGRGGDGFVVLNRSTTVLAQTLPTGLPAGSYCDIFGGEKTGTTCSGVTITVDATGKASFNVPSLGAVVVYSGAKL
jgi:alpha-amylase